MINKIIGAYLLFACILAIALKLGGVDGTVHFGTYFKSYLVQSNKELLNFKIAIPEIPLLQHLSELTPEDPIYLSNAWDYIRYMWSVALSNSKLVSAANSVIDFLNFLIRIIDILVNIINVLIQTIELIFIFLKNLIIMRDNVITA